MALVFCCMRLEGPPSRHPGRVLEDRKVKRLLVLHPSSPCRDDTVNSGTRRDVAGDGELVYQGAGVGGLRSPEVVGLPEEKEDAYIDRKGHRGGKIPFRGYHHRVRDHVATACTCPGWRYSKGKPGRSCRRRWCRGGRLSECRCSSRYRGFRPHGWFMCRGPTYWHRYGGWHRGFRLE